MSRDQQNIVEPPVEESDVEAHQESVVSDEAENNGDVTSESESDSTNVDEDHSSDTDDEPENASTSEGDPADRIAELETQLAEADAKASEALERLQRKAAEFQNTKRRQEKQLTDSIERASKRMIERILPVLDDFDLAFKNLPEGLAEEDDAWISGFRQIQKKLMQLLEDEDVAIIPLDGEFDPNRHEAVSSEPSDEVESGQIIETLRAGYEMKDRVIRPALVRVAM